VRYAYGRPITALNAGPAYNGLYAGAPFLGAGLGYAHNIGAPAAYAAAAPVAYAGHAVAGPAVAVAGPAVAVAGPAVAVAPAPEAVSGPVSSQYQAQDELGNTVYGYSNINSAKHEEGNAAGAITGSYSYNDEAGTHTVSYVADHYGFRLVAPTAIHAVADTPEVVGAKAAFFAAYDAVAAAQVHRRRRAAEGPLALPLAVGPLAPAGAPARDAVLTTIQLNPGHATFYRVD